MPPHSPYDPTWPARARALATDLAARLAPPRSAVEAAGYQWMGEDGLPGRRNLRHDGPDGRHQLQAHCHPENSPEFARHLAFRVPVRHDAAARADYAAAKARCQAVHPHEHAAHGGCKSALIDALEPRALSESPHP